MKYKVLIKFEVKSKAGIREFKPSEILSLNEKTAIPLLNMGKIEPVNPTSYRIYSKKLGECLWIVPGTKERAVLIAEGITEAIYTSDEATRLKESALSDESLKAIHKTKRHFPDSDILKITDIQKEPEAQNCSKATPRTVCEFIKERPDIEEGIRLYKKFIDGGRWLSLQKEQGVDISDHYARYQKKVIEPLDKFWQSLNSEDRVLLDRITDKIDTFAGYITIEENRAVFINK